MSLQCKPAWCPLLWKGARKWTLWGRGSGFGQSCRPPLPHLTQYQMSLVLEWRARPWASGFLQQTVKLLTAGCCLPPPFPAAYLEGSQKLVLAHFYSSSGPYILYCEWKKHCTSNNEFQNFFNLLKENTNTLFTVSAGISIFRELFL